MSTSKVGNLVITAADYYLGHHTAAYLIEHHCHKFNKIVLTAAHPDRLEHCKKENVKVVKINPNDTSSYEDAFKGADWVLFFPEPEAGRVQSANRAIDAMKNACANNVIMMSCESANSTKHRYLAEFKEMEEKLCSTMNNYVIIRSAVIQNLFHLHAPYVAKHNVFPLILSEHVEFAPVNLDDEIDACLVIMKDGIEKHRAMKYHLTGPEMVTGPKIAHELTQAINSPKKIEYKQVSSSDMEKYLESLRDRIGHHSAEDITNDHHDRLKYEFKGQPTDHQIKTFLEEMEWLEEGNGKKTDDLKMILGRDGRSVDHFFGDHKNEFVSR
jgi:uncharacterized protein YbjT (DUF2867 family)